MHKEHGILFHAKGGARNYNMGANVVKLESSRDQFPLTIFRTDFIMME